MRDALHDLLLSSLSQDVVLEAEFEGEKTKYTMIQVDRAKTPSPASYIALGPVSSLASPVGVAGASAAAQCRQAGC